MSILLKDYNHNIHSSHLQAALSLCTQLDAFLSPAASLLPSSSGLHDNPWVCDCRLYDLVQFQKSPTLSVAFIDTRLRCSAPESLSGVLFSDAELRQCQLPRIHTAVARVRSAVGNNVLLRCGTIGVPIPDLTWRRADGRNLNGTGGLATAMACSVCCG